jgi:hypothetical protein
MSPYHDGQSDWISSERCMARRVAAPDSHRNG